MILAGIDEAGYGPLLGPLVVGSCAFELPDVTDVYAPLPCLWKRLRKHVSRNRTQNHRKLHINDSKLVYSPSAGIEQLERSILAILHCSDHVAESWLDLVQHTAEHALEELNYYPWYGHDHCTNFPLANDALAIKLFANALRLEMQRTDTRCIHLQARVVLEKQLNRMIAATQNKATVLFSTAAIHIDALINRFADQGLLIFCDRQGGRGHYGPLLRQMFDEWELEIVSELESRSEYALHRRGVVVRIIFTEKAETQCMSVALASMLSKYLREGLMNRFNRYWKNHLPDLAPTAGYYTDGLRFLRDIEEKRGELGILDEDLVRCR